MADEILLGSKYQTTYGNCGYILHSNSGLAAKVLKVRVIFFCFSFSYIFKFFLCHRCHPVRNGHRMAQRTANGPQHQSRSDELFKGVIPIDPGVPLKKTFNKLLVILVLPNNLKEWMGVQYNFLGHNYIV